MKSLRRQGSSVALDASFKFSSEPEKYSSSVTTDSAAAPACSNSRPRAATSKSLRINPREGEAFFSSAITAASERLAASSRLRNPRGMCAAASFSSWLRFACARHSPTLRRVAARMSDRNVIDEFIDYTGRSPRPPRGRDSKARRALSRPEGSACFGSWLLNAGGSALTALLQLHQHLAG